MIVHAKKQGNYKKGDQMRIVVSNPHFNRDMSKYEEDKDTLIEYIENIISSNEEIDITQCTFHIQISNVPRGSKPTKIINLAYDIRTKRCITQIKNNDNLCCSRAIVTALAYHTSDIFDTKRSVEDIRKGRKVQTIIAEELCQRFGDYNEEGFTLEDIKHVEELLDIQIKVVCAENLMPFSILEKKKKPKFICTKTETISMSSTA